MKKPNVLTTAIISVVTLFIAVFGFKQCGSNTNNDVTSNIQSVVEGQKFIDSLISANRDLKKANDSLTVELRLTLLNMPEDKETQTVTKYVTRYKYRDTLYATNQDSSTHDSTLTKIVDQYNEQLASLKLDSLIQKEQYDELLRSTVNNAMQTPCEINYLDEHLALSTLCTNGGLKNLSVTAKDTLVVTHSVKKKWFLGRKTYHVYIQNTNPYVETKGEVYIIDKKLRRQAKRTNRRKNRNK